jgi:hypothetical protein
MCTCWEWHGFDAAELAMLAGGRLHTVVAAILV